MSFPPWLAPDSRARPTGWLLGSAVPSFRRRTNRGPKTQSDEESSGRRGRQQKTKRLGRCAGQGIKAQRWMRDKSDLEIARFPAISAASERRSLRSHRAPDAVQRSLAMRSIVQYAARRAGTHSWLDQDGRRISGGTAIARRKTRVNALMALRRHPGTPLTQPYHAHPCI